MATKEKSDAEKETQEKDILFSAWHTYPHSTDSKQNNPLCHGMSCFGITLNTAFSSTSKWKTALLSKRTGARAFTHSLSRYLLNESAHEHTEAFIRTNWKHKQTECTYNEKNAMKEKVSSRFFDFDFQEESYVRWYVVFFRKVHDINVINF